MLILRSAGSNCDEETAHAFNIAGGEAQRVHLNRILESSAQLNDFQILAIPGGFSYGDDISSGKIFANQLRIHLADALRAFVKTGKPIIGICNGFQILVKAGLLPGPIDQPHGATLTHNDSHRFVDRWIRLKPISRKCIWLNGVEPLALPIAHGEGKFVPANETIRKHLWDQDQIALIYTKPDGSPANNEFPNNPNGAIDDIAGICDESGLVFGLMPHPERYVDPHQHPAWTSQHPLPIVGPGLGIFRAAINHVK
ncbi:MAG TPA: phosphoribosylformylglycinamidine synthase I [Tepidisphaeraceae bacterium]